MKSRAHKITSFYLWVSIIIVFVIATAVYVNVRNPKVSKFQKSQEEATLVSEVLKQAPTRGNGNDFIIVEFGDFECPVCKQSARILEELIESRDDVKQVWIPLTNSVHPESEFAAVAGYCAHEQNQFWAFHDLIYENQSNLSTSLYNEIATRLKLDINRFHACLTGPNSRSYIKKSLEFARVNDVKSTPFLIVGDKKIEGLFTKEQVQNALNLSK